MYLLILRFPPDIPTTESFTSHYVSINSMRQMNPLSWELYLHPTMYLLIHTTLKTTLYVLMHLHPTMYLLIPNLGDCPIACYTYLHPTMYLLILYRWLSIISLPIFTSHYVSINSVIIYRSCCYFYLIYIPLCIY